MEEYLSSMPDSSIKKLCNEFEKYNHIDPELFDTYHVKRGLRNSDGTGVMAGLTLICNVHGYLLNEGEKMPIDGELIYRGINVKDIVAGCKRENRFGFEEVIWLLIFGHLPTAQQLEFFQALLGEMRELPEYFTEDVLMKAPSPNIMNKMGRAVLALYTYDKNAEDNSIQNLLSQSVRLIAKMPTLMVHAYQVKRRNFDHDTMFFHPLERSHSTAESILSTMRPDRKFTDEEAKLLDLCLILHAEHGGGNNSTFACRALSSTGTDTYSSISAAIGSLKGPRHGGANIKVMEMIDCIKNGVKDWNSDDEISEFLVKILNRQEGDHSGLIYGMGHAVYTISDPRAVILKQNAEKLAEKSDLINEFKLMENIERLAPAAYASVKSNDKKICANVDFYSGLVYKMLGFPSDLFTPLFAVARIAGWCAHRIEEISTGKRIMRPAYKAVAQNQDYLPLSQRQY
jgi:citrate synthase